MATRRYLCPFCKKRIDKEKLASHLNRAHSKDLPKNGLVQFTALQTAYHIMNKRPLDYARKCRVCGAPTAWDEKKGRYNFLCGNPACDKAWVDKMKATMGDKMGSNRPTATAEGLQKMLAGRRISGTYKFRDGHEFTYTGSYELEALKFLDQVLEVKSEDLQVPGPVLSYPFQGKNHMYITDMYYIPYNLIIEVKDGGSNPNTNNQYALTRAKQMAKENYVIKKTNFNYLRLTDNDLSQLFTVFAELKLNMVEDDDERIIRVHEDTNLKERTLDTIIFDFGNVLVCDKDPMVHNKDNLGVCFYTERLLSSLKEKGYKLYYLSNWDEESFTYQKEKGIFDFLKYFDGGIISYEVNLEKPADAIYKALIDKYQIDTEKALFLDDKQENIESARSMNLNRIVFDKSFVNILMELPAVKKSEVVSEGTIMNQKDILYNKDKFDSGEINVCFVTGLSGSGKSTLANKMEKAGVEKYELDDVLANYAFSDENLKEYGEVISGYFKGPGKRFRIQPDEKDKREEWSDREEADCVRGFIDYTLKYANSHKATKFVIEGVELYWFYKPEELRDYAVYIKGTSALISMIRSAKRDSSDVSGLARISSFLKNVFRKDRAHAYFQAETTIQKWRDFYTSVTEKSVHENMLAASQGFMLMNPNDTIIVNFMKHNTFTDESDYAIAFNQKFDRIFARDNHGILKEFTAAYLLDTTYTPYIVDDNANFVREFIENHIGTKVSPGEIYEAVFDHPLYSSDQILFEGRATKYKDYYKMLQDTDEFIAKATQPGTPEFIAPIGEAATENVATLDINDPKAVDLLKKDSYTKNYLNYLKDNTGEIVVIDDKLAGYIFVGKKKDPGFISTLEVKKEYRGKGYSKILLKDAIDKLGAFDLCVDKTNKVALNLYKKFGFVKVKSVNGDKQWYMKLKSKLNKDDEIVNEAATSSTLFHGSHVNIKGDYLIPKNNSQEDKDYVFASSDRDFALCYAGNFWHDGMINQGYYNGQLYLVEMEKGMFEKIFNTDGYVYEVEKNKNFFQRGMKTEFLTESKVKILNRTYFSNVLREIKKANIELYYYPDKPKWFKNRPVKEATEYKGEMLFRLSKVSMDDDMVKPSIPDNFLTKNGYEENKTPRVCFSTTIQGCLMGMSENLKGVELYVHIPEDLSSHKVLSPSKEEVPDVGITKEKWICEPINLRCIGKIRVTGDAGEPGIPYKYGDKTAELYKWNYEWIDKYDNSIHESADSSKLDPNFKKSSPVPYKIVEWNRVNANKYLKGYTGATLNWNLTHRVGEIAVSTTTDETIGYVLVSKTGVIQPIYVEEKFRGQGFSKILLKDAIDKFGAKKLGVYKDNEVAIKLYKSFGFKVSEDKQDHYTMIREATTNEMKNISFSDSFTDVKNIVNTLSSEELHHICNGTFKNSPYVVYRSVLKYNADPAAFIDVYSIPNEMEKGEACVVVACKEKYRGKGFTDILTKNALKTINRSNKIKKLRWETTESNKASSTLAEKNGFKKSNSSKDRNIYTMTFESALQEIGIPKLVIPNTLYHGSIHLYKELLCTGIDMGNTLQQPGWSLYTWTKYDKAIGWAVFATIREKAYKYFNYKSMGCRNSSIIILTTESYRSLIENLDKIPVEDKICYVYSIDTNNKNYEFGLGHSSNTPDCITIRYNGSIPIKKVDTFILTKDLIDKYSIISDREPTGTEYGLNARLLSFLMNHDMMYNRNIKKILSKAVKTGELNVGDDIMAYLNSQGCKFENISILRRIHDRINNESAIEDDVSKPWFIKSDDGVVNCCISVPGYEHCMRGRSSMLCLKHDTGIWEVFLRKSVDDYGAPGGGWNPNESPMEAAIREAREEARLEVSNVRRMGTLIEYHEDVHDWVKEHVKNPKDWWYGYYSAVFVGMYAGDYTGKIRDVDKDPIEYQGKWYPVEDSMPGLPKEYHEAIMNYIKEEEDRNNG